MVSTSEIILEYAVPGVATIMATVMFLAPYGDLRRAVARGYLGDLNPTPWAFMLGNCFGWVTYSILQQDYFILWANVPGFLLSVYLNLGAVKLLYQGHHAREMRKSMVSFLETEQTKRLATRSSGASESNWGRSSVRVSRVNSSFYVGNSEMNKNGSNRSFNKRMSSRTFLTAPAEDPNSPGVSRRGPRPSIMRASEDWASRRGAGGSKAPRPSLAAFSADLKSTRRASTILPDKKDDIETSLQDWATLVWNVTSQSTQAPSPHENIVLGIVVIWTACIALITFADSFDLERQKTTVGILTNLNLVFFYGAPLSTIGTVIKERNSSSIHIPTMITNTVNSSFWTAYGFAEEDPIVYGPNGLGALLGLAQVVLTGLFPRKSNDPAPGLPTRLPLQDYPPCIRLDVLQRAAEVGRRKHHAIMPIV